jgi:hypothetical protein
MVAKLLKSASSFWFITTALLGLLSVLYFVVAPASRIGVACIIIIAGLIILSTIIESSFWVVTAAVLCLLSVVYFFTAPASGLGVVYIIVGVGLIVLSILAEIKQRQTYKAYL